MPNNKPSVRGRTKTVRENNVQGGADKLKSDSPKHRNIFLISAGLVIVLGIILVSYYWTYVLPFERIVITVDDTQIPMRYFLERTKLSGSDPMTMLDKLTQEIIIKKAAQQYGIQVNEADIDKQLRVMAGSGTDITETEFQEWYRQKLNDNGISDSDYKDLVRTGLLVSRLQAYLAARVPAVAEQVHLHGIVVETDQKAQEVEARLKAGEKFADVAREFSIDKESKDKGGDLGWVAPAALDLSDLISSLNINQVSDPIPLYRESDQTSPTADRATSSSDEYYILMVSEKESARQLDAEDLKILQSRALALWFPEELKQHSIQYNFDSETLAWIQAQLGK
jgi:parvulin-like peptidyl-prolyl isomerase